MEPFRVAPKSHRLLLQQWETQFPSLHAGFTIRTDGCSKAPFASFNLGLHVGDQREQVVTNRRMLCGELGFPFSAFTCAEQIHGNKVVRITEQNKGAGRDSMEDCIAAADGTFTNEPGVLLTSYYADCVPLYFLDPTSKAVGLAHAGWRGTVARISEQMVQAFAETYGSKPENILTAIGPSIGGCCYEVDERIIEQVKLAAKSWEPCVTALSAGKYMLDLGMLNQVIMEEIGIKSEHILRTDWCTSCRTDLFFSYRKEAGKTGRMASYIGWL